MIPKRARLILAEFIFEQTFATFQEDVVLLEAQQANMDMMPATSSSISSRRGRPAGDESSGRVGDSNTRSQGIWQLRSDRLKSSINRAPKIDYSLNISRVK